MEVLKGQECPMCRKKTLELREDTRDIPHFGRAYLMSMECSSCSFSKVDVASEEEKPPVRQTIEIDSEKDLSIKIVKSADATVKIPRIVTITPGPASNGYITNVEGIINRVKHQIESAKDNEEDKEARKKAKNLLKKLNKVLWGQEKLKIILEDPSGNSAILSEKAVSSKL